MNARLENADILGHVLTAMGDLAYALSAMELKDNLRRIA